MTLSHLQKNFNSRSHVGNDDHWQGNRNGRNHFNSRSHVGNDMKALLNQYPGLYISIHVPTWGTTIVFSSASPLSPFQFTFPRGERLTVNYTGERVKDFNSRSHVGNDRLKENVKDSKVISIHVPTWGTTLWSQQCLHSQQFQFTFPRGERHKHGRFRHSLKDFNSRSHVGNDRKSYLNDPFQHRFQFTFPRGERQQIFTNILCFFMQ